MLISGNRLLKYPLGDTSQANSGFKKFSMEIVVIISSGVNPIVPPCISGDPRPLKYSAVLVAHFRVQEGIGYVKKLISVVTSQWESGFLIETSERLILATRDPSPLYDPSESS
jgi:hypothetical protein